MASLCCRLAMLLLSRLGEKPFTSLYLPVVQYLVLPTENITLDIYVANA